MSAEYKDYGRQEVQTLCHLTDRLEACRQELQASVEEINKLLRQLIKCGYYNRVSITFRCRLYETILFYQAAMEDLLLLKEGIQEEIKEEQMAELNRIADTARNLHTSLRFTWKTDSYPEDFSGQRFITLAYVYKEAAGMLKELENLETAAEELEKYANK